MTPFQKRASLFVLGVTALVSYTLHADPSPGLRFIENKNQWPQDILFAGDMQSARLALKKDRFTFYLYSNAKNHDGKTRGGKRETIVINEDGTHHKLPEYVHIYDVTFPGSSALSWVGGSTTTPTKYNYFIGNDPARWARGARGFEKVTYHEIYCDIDLDVYSQHTNLKYEWRVKAGADPSQIKMSYEGVDGLAYHENNLVMKTSVGELTELQPFAYQYIGGRQVPVLCLFRISGNVVSYDFPQGYDPCYELVIDPILIFSAYSGSFLDNWGNTATYDEHGNVYSGGMVANPEGKTGFPTTPGAYQVESAGGEWDIGILKYDSAGSSLLYATYLGGSGTETPQSLVVNSKGELLVLGVTGSADFPVTNGSVFGHGTAIDPLWGVPFDDGTDIVIAKLSEDGSALLGGTYLGGSHNDGVNFISGSMDTTTKVESPLAKNYGDQLRGDIITDENDFVYIASNTLSNDFNGVTNTFGGGSHDAVIVKLAGDLSSIITARYIGGGATDAAYSIKLFENKVFVAGGTRSINFPVVDGLKSSNAGDTDGWVASFSTSDFTMSHGTYLGTSRYDQVYLIGLNDVGEVYVFGQTQGAYPVSGGVYTNANAGQFIHKLSSDLKTTHFSTVVGSANANGQVRPNISPTAFLVSECNNLYLSGWGGETNAPVVRRIFQDQSFIDIRRNYLGGSTQGMPVTSDALQTTTSGNDFYMMVLSSDGSEFLYGTFFGGNSSAVHVDGGTSRFDTQGIVYHAVCAGCGGNSDFPAVNVPEAHLTNNSTNCNNAVFKLDLALLKARIRTNSEALDMPGLNVICLPDKLVFENLSSGGVIHEWDFGDGTQISSLTKDPIVHEYQQPGQYTVKLKAIDPGTCKVEDSTRTIVIVNLSQSEVQADDDLCFGDNYQLTATGGSSYQWTLEDGNVFSTLARPVVAPQDTAFYFVTLYEPNGCVKKDTVVLNVVPAIAPEFTFKRTEACEDRPMLEVVNLTDSLWNDDLMFFDFGDGTTSDLTDDRHYFEQDGVYKVRLVTSREACIYESAVDVPVFKITSPNVITPEGSVERNDIFTIQYGEVPGTTPGDYGFKVSLTIYNRWGTILFREDDYKYDWSGEGLAAGVYYYDVSIEDHGSCKSWLHLVK